ncbi:hypothetical protein N0V83_007588 [Neocucurbitaria cava]|uniref:Uncharacterized protein n=1 Tax=Neocucurbitaria cava TaxID=798079 RepID=A0A9W9CKJ5_9PLEO|nr:hypothetical protein N0V83_007588 [Neocucurbitaria cava]
MFNPWRQDPFQRLPFTHPSFSSYQKHSAQNYKQQHRPRPHTPRRARHSSLFNLDAIEGSDFSSDETSLSERYYLSDDHHHHNTFPSLFSKSPEDTSDHRRATIKPALHNLKLNIPKSSLETLGLREDDVLILAPGTTLTRLKVQIRDHHNHHHHATTETLRAVAVAADVRGRDIIKQLLPGLSGEVRAYVRTRGSEWQELDLGAKVGSVVAEMGGSVVELRIVVSSGSKGLERRMGVGMAWQKEMGVGKEMFWMY